MYVNTTGYLGKDAKIQYSENGTAVVRFSIADNFYDREKKTMWIQVVMFGARAENVHEYLTKGTLVQVNGLLTNFTVNLGSLLEDVEEEDDWVNDALAYTTPNVIASDVKLLSTGEEREEEPTKVKKSKKKSQSNQKEDEIPF